MNDGPLGLFLSRYTKDELNNKPKYSNKDTFFKNIKYYMDMG